MARAYHVALSRSPVPMPCCQATRAYEANQEPEPSPGAGGRGKWDDDEQEAGHRAERGRGRQRVQAGPC